MLKYLKLVRDKRLEQVQKARDLEYGHSIHMSTDQEKSFEAGKVKKRSPKKKLSIVEINAQPI